MKNNSVINDDCINAMRYIKDKSIDMILCDLPYGTTSCKWDSVIPFDLLWLHYERVIKDNGAIILFASQPFTTDLINSNRKLFKYELIWSKNQWSGFLNGNKRFLKAHENICVFYKNQPTYNPQRIEYSESTKKRYKNGDMIGISTNTGSVYSNKKSGGFTIDYDLGKLPGSILNYKCVHNGNFKRLHSTQKPVDLLEHLIKSFTNENELVLDNTAGSGSTGIACLNTNRNFILIEKDKDYYEITLNRIKNHMAQQKLF